MIQIDGREVLMRADPEKQERFAALAAGPYLHQTVAANRAYLTAAVPDPTGTEYVAWALSCLPKTGAGRLSTLNMKRMETFVLFPPEDVDSEDVGGFMVVRESVLHRHAGSGQGVEERYPHLEFDRSNPYRDAGQDQVRVWGWYDELIEALSQEPFAIAARDLASSLLSGTTNHGRHHNYQLADRVLDRVVDLADLR
ncbi:hypothetical protein O7600_24405 [Micromonospora sp. WMMA1998]|uniref:hypothetical protein n=1 Tax=Micromonospora sp. WMMA1998 TaxID=3015167 RepID=UPI00248A977D|nr:hypothetical protein [Micromonospora sp. WMMA1998]WBC14218.1 hypothetical protein O7600_24405 [Micromonospora sp. WMMA1998]